MHSNGSHNSRSSNKYSGKKFAIPVNFSCHAPEAKLVTVVGDFNQWQPKANPMSRQPDGAWTLQVEMCHGHHHYQFLVDGEARLDPGAQRIGRNEQNERVSLMAVS